jgi:hypothetical protein
LLAVFFTATLSSWLAPGLAHGQPVLAIRCSLDSLDPVAAEARLAWARRCALLYHVGNPGAWMDTFIPSSNDGSTLKDYAEDSVNTNPLGHNRYIGQLHNFEANAATVFSLYLSAPTAQLIDANGYYSWERPLSRKKPRPHYPTFGTLADIYSPSNAPLYPNPYNSNDCGLYHASDIALLSVTPGKDTQVALRPIEHPCLGASEGTQCLPEPDPDPIPAASFYINAYCESSCYAPDQRVLFPEGPAAISEAHALRTAHVMTVTPDSSLHQIRLQSLPTYSYTAEFRDSTHPIVELKMASGGALRVTTEHPLVNGEGRLVQAQTLKVGDELVRKNGDRDPIVGVTRAEHFGKVYNLRPNTDDRVSNLLVAEDYLVGSSLFQNDEVGYVNRIILFKSLPSELIP